MKSFICFILFFISNLNKKHVFKHETVRMHKKSHLRPGRIVWPPNNHHHEFTPVFCFCCRFSLEDSLTFQLSILAPLKGKKINEN